MAHDLMLPEGVTSSLQYSKLIVPPIQWWLVLQGLEICKNFDAASAEIYYHTWGLVGLQGCLATSFNRSVAAAGMSLLLNFTISQKVGSLFRICMWWLPSLAAPQSLRLILCDSTLVLSPLWFTVLCRHRPHRGTWYSASTLCSWNPHDFCSLVNVNGRSNCFGPHLLKLCCVHNGGLLCETLGGLSEHQWSPFGYPVQVKPQTFQFAKIVTSGALSSNSINFPSDAKFG